MNKIIVGGVAGILSGALIFSIFSMTNTKLAIVSTVTPEVEETVVTPSDQITLEYDTIDNEAALARTKKRRQPPSAAPATTSPAISTTTTTTTTTTPTTTVIPTTAIVPTATTRPLQTMAWIYPGNPACSASTEYADGRAIDILKSEFFTVRGGTLTLLTTTNSGCNGYSPETIARLKQYSKEQYVTISSASTYDMDAFFKTALLQNSPDITTLVNFVVSNNLAGIELDFEDFSSWTPTSYTNYKQFASVLGTALHNSGKKLMLNAPAISATSEESWFLWRYSDFVSLPVDTIVIMAYDYQFDHGVGSPITPLSWLKNVIAYTTARYPKEKLSIGLPSYGYQGAAGTYRSTILTAAQIKTKPGYLTAARDPASGELTWKDGNSVYFYQDATSLRLKRDVVVSAGLNSISIWHLGGNEWF